MADALDRLSRNQRIAAARAEGEAWSAIAEREGISVRQAQRAADAARRERAHALNVVSLDELDSAELAAEAMAVQRQVLDELGRLGRMASPSAARVGAIKARATVAAQMIELAVLVGLAPPSRVDWQLFAQVEHTAKALWEVVEQFGVDPDAFLAALEERHPALAQHPSPTLRRAA